MNGGQTAPGAAEAAEASAAATESSAEVAAPAMALIEEPMAVLAVLLLVLAGLFGAARHPRWGRVFKVVPLLVFAYFVPTALSNLGVIPLESPLYEFVKDWLLPASLLLLTLSIDIPAILGLGPKVLALFAGATASVVLGGPIAYLLVGSFTGGFGEDAWKGLAALSGSWIGGGANFIALKESVGAPDDIIGLMIVIDVAVANVWMAALLWFAGREVDMDARIGADRRSLDVLRAKVESFRASVIRPAKLADLLTIAALGIGGSALAAAAAGELPELEPVISGFTWVVIIATAAGVAASFTPLRSLEGAGASTVGSLFLYLLVATIGAKASFAEIGKAGPLFAVGAVWMAIHAGTVLALRRLLRAPIFVAAVASQANIGGAASAPIVASAFHPALAPVGVLLAVCGYALGTYAALICAYLLRLAYGVVG